ncbi:MAG: M1 family metallopeptidase [Patescibacteria group bacterium]
MVEENPYRLPRNVEPLEYHLCLTPNLENFTFHGHEGVEVNVTVPTSEITLHALDLTVKNISVYQPGIALFFPQDPLVYDTEYQTVTIPLGRTLSPGSACLYLEFTGEINDKLCGLYRTSYKVGGEKRWGCSTQFESTDARRMFPCWDEPDQKAKFNLTLLVPKDKVALSNMPITSEFHLETNLKRLRYQITPPMSTYLLAIVIADLECLETTDANGVPIRVWTLPGKKEHGQFALDVALHTLPYLAEWFGIPYELPKLDLVAVPDFAAGAMENWGLITFRETALLVDPEQASAVAKQYVANVVNHEIAHMWFGDRTTMRSWTDLWLNEGFASYMGPKATDRQFPEWDMWTQFLMAYYTPAFHDDALRHTHPVEVEVKNPGEIGEIFDRISYNKGAVVTRMLAEYLGEDDFRRGLHEYFTRHAYGNATTDELWVALGEASGKPVRHMMASYTRQPGFPLVNVDDERENGKYVLRFSQQRFFIDGGPDARRLCWNIPVSLLTSSGTKISSMLECRTSTVEIPGNAEWIKVNPGQNGFYRVLYPPHLLRALAGAVERGALTVVDRLGLLDDAFALARAGYIGTREALDLLLAYRDETDYSVWSVIASGIGSLRTLLWYDHDHPLVFGNLCHFGRSYWDAAVQRMGWDKRQEDSHTDILLRSLAIREAGRYGHAHAVDTARQRFMRVCRGEALDPDLRSAVYSVAASTGREQQYEGLLALYRTTNDAEEKLRILSAMGSFTDKGVLQEALAFSLSEEVRSQDTPTLLASVRGNAVAQEMAWEFIKQQWGPLVKRCGAAHHTMPRIVNAVTNGFALEDHRHDVEKFFRRNTVPGIERTVQQSLEIIRSNIAWLERDSEDIRQWLLEKESSSVHP